MVVIEVDFYEEAPDDKPEPLEMEHFYFPLGLWTAGLVVSTIFLLAEMFIRRKSKRDLPMLRPEEPPVAQSQLEDEHNSAVEDNEDTKV